MFKTATSILAIIKMIIKLLIKSKLNVKSLFYRSFKHFIEINETVIVQIMIQKVQF